MLQPTATDPFAQQAGRIIGASKALQWQHTLDLFRPFVQTCPSFVRCQCL
jgi:hypothetical protein